MEQYSAVELIKHGGITIPIFESQIVVANGNSNDNPINVLPFSRGMFFLRCTQIAGGGSEELDVWIETKDPAGEYWFTLTSFWPVLTEIGGRIKTPFLIPILGEKISIAWDLTDITSVTFSVYGVFKI